MDKDIKEVYYDASQGLLSMKKLYEKLKEIGKPKTMKQVKEFLAVQEPQQVFHQRHVKTHFPLVSYAPFERLQIDLLDVSNLASHNGNYKFIFCCIDVYTKFAWALPIKSKADTEVLSAFKHVVYQIEDYMGLSPQSIDCDKEASFRSRQFKKFAADNDISLHYVEDNLGVAVVERFNRTIRQIIGKYMTAFHTQKYIDKLPKLMENYNHTYHSNIQTTPFKAINNNAKYEERMNEQFENAKAEANKKNYSGFKVGNTVRLLIGRTLFDKKTDQKFTKTVHVIEAIEKGEYKVSDRVKLYKPYELLKADKSEQHIVQDEKDKDIEIKVKANEKKQKTTKRRLRKEGVQNKHIVQEVNARVLRRYRKERDHGPFIVS